jgi:hypothetical protein
VVIDSLVCNATIFSAQADLHESSNLLDIHLMSRMIPAYPYNLDSQRAVRALASSCKVRRK